MIKALKLSDISDYEVVNAVDEYRKRIRSGDLGSGFPYEKLAEKFRCPEKLAYSACERAERNGLIEYGVSLRSGWLTEKGIAILNSQNEAET